ncbi:hypothetical protein LJC60_09720 [Ruminococcaceae bacterium OttesenSCG-928-D13]|nr:hypothetical protein [Ruminococcaceae bacterium OttesenSCG-928-D13]
MKTKKNRIPIIILCCLVAALAIGVGGFMLFGRQPEGNFADASTGSASQGAESAVGASVTPAEESHEIFCEAKDEAEAQRVAEFYGGEVISFSEGIAIIRTEQPAREAVEKSIYADEDLPPVYVNQQVSGY